MNTSDNGLLSGLRLSAFMSLLCPKLPRKPNAALYLALYAFFVGASGPKSGLLSPSKNVAVHVQQPSTGRQRSKSTARERGSKQHLLRMAETADDSAMIISASPSGGRMSRLETVYFNVNGA